MTTSPKSAAFAAAICSGLGATEARFALVNFLVSVLLSAGFGGVSESFAAGLTVVGLW
jgi:hypothetical protein